MRPYQYEETLRSDQLRLLKLHASPSFDGEIVCDLETISRDACPKYTALSYSWGDANQPREMIKIADYSLEIRRDLAQALRHLRSRTNGDALWIDAICINQDDQDGTNTEEKSAQVRRMDDTYRQAAKVIVYLGANSEEEKSWLAMATIDELGSQLDFLPLKDIPSTPLSLPDKIREHGPLEYGTALLRLLLRPWFQRLWVIQEICLAPADVTMLCGDIEVPFARLTSLQCHFSLMMSLALHCRDGIVSSRHMLLTNAQEPAIGLTRQYFVAGRKGIDRPRQIKCTLLSHLWNFRNRQCKDPKDRVYSLLGISSDIWVSDESQGPESIQRSRIDPDYSKTVEEVYTSATRVILTTHKKLDVISMCHGPLDESGRPSWVPNFSASPMSKAPTSLTVYTDNKPYFYASGGSMAEMGFSDDGLKLKLTGYFVDSIESVVHTHGDDWADGLRDSRALVLWQGALGQSQYTDVDDAYWRTLITNRNAYRQPADAEIEGREFHDWWDNIFTDPTTRRVETEKRFIHFTSAWIQHFHYRNFFVTETGYMGLCPLWAEAGDQICILGGGQVPLVLRPDGKEHRVIGECYMHGIMDGKPWNEWDGRMEKREFCLR